MSKPIAYIFFDKERTWDCAITTIPSEYEGVGSWYLGGEVYTMMDVLDLLDDHGFDHDYFYKFVDAMPIQLVLQLNKY